MQYCPNCGAHYDNGMSCGCAVLKERIAELESRNKTALSFLLAVKHHMGSMLPEGVAIAIAELEDKADGQSAQVGDVPCRM